MKKVEKWKMYIDSLQAHPCACKGEHSIKNMYFITQFIPPEKYPKMLDIGAGEGLETHILQQLGYDVTGIIHGKTNILHAKTNYPTIKFIDADFHDLPFTSETFDCAYMNQAFEHAYAPYILLLELYCVLKEKGKIWISLPYFKEIDDQSAGESNKLSHHHPNILCDNLFTELFESSGFKIIYHTSMKHKVHFNNPFLLEKQPLSSLHSDVKATIEKRKELFG